MEPPLGATPSPRAVSPTVDNGPASDAAPETTREPTPESDPELAHDPTPGPASPRPASSEPASPGLSSGPASSSPSVGPPNSAPVSPVPASSIPASLDVASPSPASSGPVSSVPASSAPASPGPASPDPASPDPASQSRTSLNPASPGPANPGPTSPGPASSRQLSPINSLDQNILPEVPWVQEPVQVEDLDRDSAYGTSIISDITSLADSIFQYRNIEGRTYHSERSATAYYWGPNDDRHNQFLDIIHHVLTLALDNRLFCAPLDMTKVVNVLDVGTGTGMWAIEFADRFPNAQVVGTDISPIQPTWVPPNISFEMEDCTQPWTYDEESFDFVHIRYLFGSIPNWTELFRQAYRVLKPGGWIETFEADAMLTSEDGPVKEGTPLDQWGKTFREAGDRIGRSFCVINDDLQRKGLEEAGFIKLCQWDFNCPLTGWPKDEKLKLMGEYMHASMEQDMEGVVLYTFKEIMGWTTEEIKAYTAELRQQLRDKSIHPVFKLRCIYAQKPLNPSNSSPSFPSSSAGNQN